MKNIVVWGAGKRCKIVLEAIRKDRCNFIGIVDSNKSLHKNQYMGKWSIGAPVSFIDKTVDYIIISVESCDGILLQCEQMGIEKNRIIRFWDSDSEFDFIDSNVKKIYILEKELEKCKNHLRNIPFELGMKLTPTIRPAEELLRIILQEKRSLSRFGDGELEIMQRRERPWFQAADKSLAERLRNIFHSKEEKIIIALADDFGSLEHYTQNAADEIREYLEMDIREDLMKEIDFDRVYYDAYVTRPYMMYKDKEHAKNIFGLFKKIWEQRDILLVEGMGVCTGVGNDLLCEASKIQRIIAPPKNAFSAYNQILSLIKENTCEDTLVLISLGPTATVLAYDLAMEGIQALDIGQLDIEYEWYLRRAEKRIKIPGKCVAELEQWKEGIIMADQEYEDQIIAVVQETESKGKSRGSEYAD